MQRVHFELAESFALEDALLVVVVRVGEASPQGAATEPRPFDGAGKGRALHLLRSVAAAGTFTCDRGRAEKGDVNFEALADEFRTEEGLPER